MNSIKGKGMYSNYLYKLDYYLRTLLKNNQIYSTSEQAFAKYRKCDIHAYSLNLKIKL